MSEIPTLLSFAEPKKARIKATSRIIMNIYGIANFKFSKIIILYFNGFLSGLLNFNFHNFGAGVMKFGCKLDW